jgi:hypothetical protein
MFPLTPEQCDIIDFFMTGESMRDIAYAGGAKTSTLIQKAKRSMHRRGLYIAFNKSIAAEASEKFPRNVRCSTAHSLAYRDVIGQGFNKAKMESRPASFMIDLNMITEALPFHRDILKSIAHSTITRFCSSDSREITEHHVPRQNGLSEDDQEFAFHWAPIVATAAWERMSNPRSDFPLGHDGYLKVWSLGTPKLPCDFLMIDEAQDLNPVLIHVVKNQRGTQTVAVGDPWQAIYEWRGAKDALAILAGREFRLTRSFRFGDAIAAAANQIIAVMGETFPLLGFPMIKDRVSFERSTDVDAVLCRSNAGVIERALDFLDEGREVCTPGGTREMMSLIQDAEALQNFSPARTADLMTFKSWKEVQKYAGTDEGASLRVFVRMVDKYGCSKLQWVLSRIRDKPVEGGVTISTAHKGKGLEWKRVAIHDDFAPNEDGKISVGERRLFYVAITRAKQVLHVDPETLAAFSTPDPEGDDD